LETIFYRVNEPHVISEVIEGEVIILNFESGTYYSLNESGMIVWQLILAGCGRNELLVQLKQRYADGTAVSQPDLEALLQQLENEALIVPAHSSGTHPDAHIMSTSGPYEIPQLEKFTDLQSLLLLDPIHDVDAMGWPHQAN
jgi:hypothetical protein